MKYLGLVLGLLLLPLSQLRAQVSVEVKLPQKQFLAGESLPVAVRIINRSGQKLNFGEDPDWLTFTVEAHDNFVVGKNGEVPVTGQFSVESSQVATKHLDLAPYFELSRPGHYDIIATLRVKNWDRQVASSPVSFDIVNGAKLWSTEFGVPMPPGSTNAAPEVRKYTLLEANYLSSELRLYVELTDSSDSRIIKVFAIGPMVSFGQPEAQLDRSSDLHVLYQTGARSFNYTVLNPDGTILIRQTYDYSDTRPRLRVDGHGNITVMGGARRETASDLPVPAELN